MDFEPRPDMKVDKGMYVFSFSSYYFYFPFLLEESFGYIRLSFTLKLHFKTFFPFILEFKVFFSKFVFFSNFLRFQM